MRDLSGYEGYTPEPWSIDLEYLDPWTHRIDAPTWGALAIVVVKMEDEPGKFSEAGIANTRLIAAAPALAARVAELWPDVTNPEFKADSIQGDYYYDYN